MSIDEKAFREQQERLMAENVNLRAEVARLTEESRLYRVGWGRADECQAKLADEKKELELQINEARGWLGFWIDKLPKDATPKLQGILHPTRRRVAYCESCKAFNEDEHRPGCGFIEKPKEETQDPFVGCRACGSPKLCHCGHPVAMHRPKCFWIGLCGCATELPADLVAQAVAMEHREASPRKCASCGEDVGERTYCRACFIEI